MRIYGGLVCAKLGCWFICLCGHSESILASVLTQGSSVGWSRLSLCFGVWPTLTPLAKLGTCGAALTHMVVRLFQMGKGALWPLPVHRIGVMLCGNMSGLEGADVCGPV